MKKLISLSLLALTFGLTACGATSGGNTSENGTVITIGATSVPHSEILNEIVPDLKEKGIDLKVEEFSEYTLLNPSLTEGDLDANFFQHTQYLDNYVAESGEKLVSLGGVHIEPMGVYSKTIKSLDELKEGDKIAIPNDATNGTRALMLLEESGTIKLDDAATTPTIFDITENPKNIEVIEMDAAALPRTLEEVAAAVINTNYALEGNLNPLNDAIVLEGEGSDFANVLVVREGDENKEELLAVYEALTSDKVKTFIEEKYSGAVIPAF